MEQIVKIIEMFLGPLEQAKPWDTRSIDGVGKFLRRFGLAFQWEWPVIIEWTSTDKELKILHKRYKENNDRYWAVFIQYLFPVYDHTQWTQGNEL